MCICIVFMIMTPIFSSRPEGDGRNGHKHTNFIVVANLPTFIVFTWITENARRFYFVHIINISTRVNSHEINLTVVDVCLCSTQPHIYMRLLFSLSLSRYAIYMFKFSKLGVCLALFVFSVFFYYYYHHFNEVLYILNHVHYLFTCCWMRNAIFALSKKLKLCPWISLCCDACMHHVLALTPPSHSKAWLCDASRKLPSQSIILPLMLKHCVQ